MSETRREKARECMRKLHEKRKAMGICVLCSGMIDNTKYSLCASCRVKKREQNAAYKEMKEVRKLLHEKLFAFPQEEKIIPEDHKCWTCVWSKFEGDRFFCPFPLGICEKENCDE